MEVTNKNVLVHRYLSHQMDEKERERYEAWLYENAENQMIHQQIQEIWEQPAAEPKVLFDKNAAFKKHLALLQAENNLISSKNTVSSPVVEKPLLTIVENKKEVTNVRRMPWMLAAAACMTLLIGALFVFNNEKIEQSYQASDVASVASLRDGSKVHLNQGTSLDVIESSNSRKVELKGEAFFDVAPDAAKPFIIKAGDALVTVVGTEFMLSTIDKTLIVKEGKVTVELNGQLETVSEGQTLNFADENNMKLSEKALDESQLWFNEDLKFSNAPFDKVIATIAKHFDVKINVPNNRDWQGCTFTANSLKNEKLEDVLIILQLTYELQYTKISDKEYKISKVRCK